MVVRFPSEKLRLASATLPRREKEINEQHLLRRSSLPQPKKKQGRKRPCLGVSVVGVTGYGRNILLRPTSPKPNRPAATPNNTVPPDTRMPARDVTDWAGFFMNIIIS